MSTKRYPSALFASLNSCSSEEDDSMSFIFRFDEDLGRGFSEQSLSLPTSQSATKVISLVDFGRFLSSSFLHLGVPRKPERFLLLLLLTTAALDPTRFPLGIMKTIKRCERPHSQSKMKQARVLCTEGPGLLSEACLDWTFG